MKLLFYAFLLFVFTICVSAQSTNKGTLEGIIIDEFGAVIPQVRIHAKSKDGKTFETTSNADGTYKLVMEAGIFSLFFSLKPFEPFKIEEYQMPDTRMRLDVSLICKDCEVIIH